MTKGVKKTAIGSSASIAVSRSVSFSGPLPPADEFVKYVQASPGAGDHILTTAETAMAHGHRMELALVDRTVEDDRERSRRMDRGQIMGFITGLVLLGCATALGLTGHEWACGALITSGSGGLIGTMWVARRRGVELEREATNPDPPRGSPAAPAEVVPQAPLR